jgi:tetratricopeptide (TPR) repeat protein
MPQPNIKDSVLVRMLSCLSRKELKGFQAYLGCQLFNTNQTLEKVLAYLSSKALKAPDKLLPETKMAKDLGLSPNMADKLFSQLLGHLNRFVFVWEQRNNPQSEHAGTIEFWIGHGLEHELLEREFRKMKRKFKQEPASGSVLHNHLLLQHQYAIYQTSLPRKDQGDLFEENHKLLDHYYWITKLKYLCASVNVSQIFQKKEIQNPSLPPPSWQEHLPRIGKAYYKAYLLLTAEDPMFADATQLFELLKESAEDFAGEDRVNLYGFLLNTCAKGIYKGRFDFEQLMLSTYEAVLEAGFLITNEKISSAHFKNIVSLYTRLDNCEGAQVFMNGHESLLPELDKEELLAFCHGLVAFYQGNHSEAISRFRSIIESSPEDLFWGLDARNMLWQAYFEGGDELSFEEQEDMLKLYHSFRIFVSRNNRISDHQKKCYENFIRIFNRLTRTNDKGKWANTKQEFTEILEDALASEELMHKRWLTEAIQRKIDQFP